MTARPSIFQSAWADRFVELGRLLYRFGSQDQERGLRIACILPTLAFSEHLIALGYLTEEFRQSDVEPDKEILRAEWSQRIGERASLIYQAPGSAHRTCIRNGSITENTNSRSGLGLILENAKCERVLDLKFDQLSLLGSPVDSHFLTSTHTRSECAQSIGFLSVFLGSQNRALRFVRKNEAKLLLNSSSQKRLKDEATEDLTALDHLLRLEDIVRMGSKLDALPRNVFWRQEETYDTESVPSIFSGSAAVLEGFKSRSKMPVVFILSRDDSKIFEASEKILSRFQHPKAVSCTELFSNNLGSGKTNTIELLAWR